MAKFDLVIRGGTVVTAADTVVCDVGIKAGKVVWRDGAVLATPGRGEFLRCDLDMGLAYKKTSFDFAANRRPEHYKPITERAGVVLPPK